ncbi:MAG: glycosyltransferase, partial [Polyangiales bacterium]
VLELGKLMRAQDYDLVHTHAPVASVLGRVAAKLAGVERIVYTAHEFYFHDDMPRQKYAIYHGIEKSVKQITDRILVQSQEDFDTAVTAGLGAAEKIRHLGNGIDLGRFNRTAMNEERRKAVGTVDDARGLSVRLRDLVQLISAGLAVFLLGSFPGLDAVLGQIGAPWLTPLLSVIAITALINLYNFMDGLVGGCCAVQLAFFDLYLNQPGWWLLVAALVASLLWNWPPARIFMGDSGSTVLGGAVALALLRAPAASTMWWAAP